MKREKSKSTRPVNQVRIEFTNKPITAWGGVGSLIARYVEKIDLRSWVNQHLPIQELSNNAKGVYEKVLASFLTVLVGGERFAHLLLWQHGVEAMQKTFAVEWLPKASSTITRFWKKIHSQSLAEQVGDATRSLARQIVGWEGIPSDNLNLDSTVLTRYGEQQGAQKGYNPKKRGRPSHHPLLAFLGSGYVVNLWNRSGNTSSGQSAREFFQQTVLALGTGFSIRRVLCDSGFYLIDFIRHLENEGYLYVIAVPLFPIIQEQVRRIAHWTPMAKGIEVGEFAFEHLDEKWTQKRRYVVVRKSVKSRPQAVGKQLWFFESGEAVEYRLSVMITNDSESTPQTIWEEYRPRANDENVIKDLKEGYGFAAFNLDNFWATEAFMQMNALIFHNLIHYLNRNILNGKRPQEQMKTLRNKYLIVPAQLGSGGGYFYLRIGIQNKKFRSQFKYKLEQISRLPERVNCNAFAGP